MMVPYTFMFLNILHSVLSVAAQGLIPNPITATSFTVLIDSITAQLVPIATVLAVVAIIFTGFKFLTAALSGNPGQLTESKKMFYYVLVGTAITVGAAVLANAVVKFVTELE